MALSDSWTTSVPTGITRRKRARIIREEYDHMLSVGMGHEWTLHRLAHVYAVPVSVVDAAVDPRRRSKLVGA